MEFKELNDRDLEYTNGGNIFTVSENRLLMCMKEPVKGLVSVAETSYNAGHKFGSYIESHLK